MSVRHNIGGIKNLVTTVRSLANRVTNNPYTTINTADASYNSFIQKAKPNNILIVGIHFWGDARYKVGK